MPTRRYGQHFLADLRIVDRIAEAAGLSAEDGVLEIGPGQGVLTRALAERARKVLAIEIDRRLHAALVVSGLPPNVELQLGDALRLDLAGMEERLGAGWKLVSNLPYEITSAVLERFLSGAHRPKRLVLMLQKEVGERIVAKPGDMNRLAVFCGYYAECSYLFTVPAGAFSPPPKVQSCVVRLEPRPEPLLPPVAERRLFELSALAFNQPRKQLKNTLAGMLGERLPALLQAAGIRPEARPEEIALNQWISLARSV